MADSITTFGLKTARMGHELTKLEERSVQVASLAVKKSVLVQMQLAGVNGGRLRGVGKKGAKVGVRYDQKGKAALVRATGPFHLLERPTKGHRTPKERAANSRAKRKVVNIPGVGVRAFANVAGTKGKYPWAKGVEAAIPIQHKAQGIALHQAVKKAYQ